MPTQSTQNKIDCVPATNAAWFRLANNPHGAAALVHHVNGTDCVHCHLHRGVEARAGAGAVGNARHARPPCERAHQPGRQGLANEGIAAIGYVHGAGRVDRYLGGMVETGRCGGSFGGATQSLVNYASALARTAEMADLTTRIADDRATLPGITDTKRRLRAERDINEQKSRLFTLPQEALTQGGYNRARRHHERNNQTPSTKLKPPLPSSEGGVLVCGPWP